MVLRSGFALLVSLVIALAPAPGWPVAGPPAGDASIAAGSMRDRYVGAVALAHDEGGGDDRHDDADDRRDDDDDEDDDRNGTTEDDDEDEDEDATAASACGPAGWAR